MNFPKLVFWIGLLMMNLTVPQARAGNISNEIDQANRNFLDQNFQKAAEQYQQILAGNYVNGHINYNLGNTYMMQGKTGKAIHQYLKAKLLLPRDEDVNANLEQAVRSTQDILQWERPHPASAVLFWLEDFTLAEHLKAVLLLNIAFWLGLSGWHITQKQGWATGSKILAGCLVLALVSSATRWHLESNWNYAVVQSPSLNVVSGENNTPQSLFKLHHGTIVSVMATRDQWMQIELADGRQGWVQKNEMIYL